MVGRGGCEKETEKGDGGGWERKGRDGYRESEKSVNVGNKQ